MEFVNDIHSLLPSRNIKFSLEGVKLPNNKDLFFRAKQQEIIEWFLISKNFVTLIAKFFLFNGIWKGIKESPSSFPRDTHTIMTYTFELFCRN